MRYPNYAQDFAEMSNLLRAHQQSGATGITQELARATSVACNYFKNLMEEREFFEWMENIESEIPPDREFSNCINELIIPQTRELMQAAGYNDFQFIDHITSQAQTLLNRKKAGLEPGSSIRDHIQNLRIEICLHAGSLQAKTGSYSKTYGAGGSAVQEDESPQVKKTWDKLMKASIVIGAIASLGTIYDLSEKHVFDKDKEEKEQKAQPAKPQADDEKTYRVTAEFWIDILRKLPPEKNDMDDSEW